MNNLKAIRVVDKETANHKNALSWQNNTMNGSYRNNKDHEDCMLPGYKNKVYRKMTKDLLFEAELDKKSCRNKVDNNSISQGW